LYFKITFIIILPMKLLSVTALFFLFLAFGTKEAHAYLDPGSGSYILQLIVAGGIGAIFGIKTFWHQIKIFFTNLLKMNKNTPPAKKTKKDNGK